MLSAVTHTHQGLSEQSPRKIFLVEVGRKGIGAEDAPELTMRVLLTDCP